VPWPLSSKRDIVDPEDVIAAAAIHAVGAGAAVKDVIARIRDEDVIPAIAEKPVVAGKAVELFRRGAADQRVSATRADLHWN
jgi:hypothetical protein